MKRFRRSLVLVALLLTGACTGPQASFVAATRGIYSAIAPAHRGYLEADGSLTTAQRARRLRTVDAWDLMLRKAEGGQ